MVLGGAPFNVAWHLQGFGQQPLFVSRVGTDEAGDRVLASMHTWGLDTQGLQVDPQHPTGTVDVTINNGQPSYNIVPRRAYDFIDYQPVARLLDSQSVNLIYHGSLIERHDISRKTLAQLKNDCNCPVFVDINLRAPWWNKQQVLDAIAAATWLKLNDEELAEIESIDNPDQQSLEKAGRQLLSRTRIDHLIVTRGARGATIMTPGESLSASSEPVRDLVDSVGAGDAFASICLLGMAQSWELAPTLERALAFAADICRQRGATVQDRDFYTSWSRQWSL